MPSRVRLDTARRWLQYGFYDWTRGMPKYKRAITWAAILVQGYAIWFVLSRSQVWVYMVRENKLVLYLGVFLLYLLGERVMHGLVTSEIVRKTQLEADQIAAQQIQKTLQPEKLEELVGYEMEVFYEPFRAVGGDYFDVIDLPGSRTLFAVADVSGKGMAAALLAANIQALVRSLANVDAEPLVLVNQINKHLRPHLMISEIRTVAADTFWLSPCYKQPCATIHFTWKPDWPAVRKLLPVIERELSPFKAKPHWGKLFSASPTQLRSIYEKLPDFIQLSRKLDPKGKFRNEFLDTNVFSN